MLPLEGQPCSFPCCIVLRLLCSSVSLFNRKTMTLLFIIYLKTKDMKKDWKIIVLYVIRVIEVILTGAAGGAASQLL